MNFLMQCWHIHTRLLTRCEHLGSLDCLVGSVSVIFLFYFFIFFKKYIFIYRYVFTNRNHSTKIWNNRRWCIRQTGTTWSLLPDGRIASLQWWFCMERSSKVKLKSIWFHCTPIICIVKQLWHMESIDKLCSFPDVLIGSNSVTFEDETYKYYCGL